MSLELTTAALAKDAAIQKETYGLGMTTLTILNKKMGGISKGYQQTNSKGTRRIKKQIS